MKKIISCLVLAVIMLIPISVFAQGGFTVSPSSLEIEIGKTKTFTITVTNAFGDFNLESSDETVATIDNTSVVVPFSTSEDDSLPTVTKTITVTGVKAGTSTITIAVDDAVTGDEEDLAGQTKTVSVTVIPKLTWEIVTDDAPEGEQCVEENHMIYKDKKYSYFVANSCVAKYTYIKYSDGTRVAIKKALEDGDVTISEVESAGLTLTKVPVTGSFVSASLLIVGIGVTCGIILLINKKRRMI